MKVATLLSVLTIALSQTALAGGGPYSRCKKVQSTSVVCQYIGFDTLDHGKSPVIKTSCGWIMRPATLQSFDKYTKALARAGRAFTINLKVGDTLEIVENLYRCTASFEIAVDSVIKTGGEPLIVGDHLTLNNGR